MTTVLIPLDGSGVAERAIHFATPLARRLGAGLVLVRSWCEGTELEAERYLADVVDRYQLDPGTQTLVSSRFPPEAMAEAAAAFVDPVICMDSHGRSGLAHALLGSASEDILVRSGAPVVACGPQAHESALEHARMGLCVDAGTHETPVTQFCVHWARVLDLDVDVLTVRPEDDRPISRFHEASPEQLEECASILRANGVKADVHVLEELQPARRLARYAEDRPLALLVAAKRSGTGLPREVLGSTAMGLVHRSPCPVLLPPVHPQI